MIYDSPALYIESATSKIERAERYQAIITALESSALLATESAHLDEYMLDDGQSKIKTIYRSPKAIAEAISMYTLLLNRVLNSLNGRVVSLRDGRSLNPPTL